MWWPIIFPDRVWLPGQAEWSDVQFGGIWFVHAVPWLSLLLLILRGLCSRISEVVGSALGVSGKSCSKPVENAVLQAAFSRRRRPSAREEAALAEEVGWPAHRVRRWMHRARNWRKPSTLTKFNECSWHLILYTSSTIYGWTVLVNEPYFLDLSQCYADYPSQAPSDAAMSYWCLQVALYLSELVCCLSGDVHRKKDFAALLVHHCMTLALLLISYTINMIPIGLIIAVLHDVADVFLELAKLLVYTACSMVADAVFIAFSLVFVATRLVVLPNWILPSLVYDLPQQAGQHSHITKAAIVFLVGLLGLHLYWLTLIIKVGLQLLAGPHCKDSRSDSELSDSDSSPSHTITS